MGNSSGSKLEIASCWQTQPSVPLSPAGTDSAAMMRRSAGMSNKGDTSVVKEGAAWEVRLVKSKSVMIRRLSLFFFSFPLFFLVECFYCFSNKFVPFSFSF